MIALSLLGGLACLLAGGELLVRGAVGAARALGVSPLMVGLTIVGFGTSTPELVTSLKAAFAGSPGIAVGNVVGSNIANILLILGIAALLAPVLIGRAAFRRDAAVLLLSLAALAAVVHAGAAGRLAGLGLVAALAAYLVLVYRAERVAAPEPAPAGPDAIPPRLGAALPTAVAGLALTLLGAHLLVEGAVGLARLGGLSETVIGLTIVAVGTSLPELVTSIVAAIRRQGDVAFGNIVGSNVFNILGILGVTALVHPVPIPPEIARLDLWVVAGATLALVVAGVALARIPRAVGGLFLAAYAGYLAVLAVAAGG